MGLFSRPQTLLDTFEELHTNVKALTMVVSKLYNDPQGKKKRNFVARFNIIKKIINVKATGWSQIKLTGTLAKALERELAAIQKLPPNEERMTILGKENAVLSKLNIIARYIYGIEEILGKSKNGLTSQDCGNLVIKVNGMSSLVSAMKPTVDKVEKEVGAMAAK